MNKSVKYYGNGGGRVGVMLSGWRRLCVLVTLAALVLRRLRGFGQRRNRDRQQLLKWGQSDGVHTGSPANLQR